MDKLDLQKLIVECLHECAAEQQSKQVKEHRMTLKKSELQSLVNEVVRQCVKEAGPQYKVRGKKSQLEQPGLRNKAREMQDDPEINEVAPPGGEDVVKAIKRTGTADNPWAVAWSMKNKGQIEAEGAEGEEHAEYDEQEEIRLLKAMGQAILVLLKMHRGMDEPEGEVGAEPEIGGEPAAEPEADGVPFKGAPEAGEEEKDEPEGEEKPSFPPKKEEEPKEDDELNEAEVQARSFRTVKDAPQNPKNVRDPKVPRV